MNRRDQIKNANQIVMVHALGTVISAVIVAIIRFDGRMIVSVIRICRKNKEATLRSGMIASFE